MNMLNKKTPWMIGAAAVMVSSLAFAGVDVEDGARAGNSSFSSVNKQITVGDDAQVGDVDSVNGSIKIGSLSVVGDVESVNGGIRIGKGTTLRSVESVNGGIRIGSDVQIERNVESVNGGIDMSSGTTVGGDIKTVNGGLDLDGVLIEGGITTINGGVYLKNGTEVMGDLLVKKPSGWGGWGKRKPVQIEIGADSVVHGDLYFEHKVKLKVHPTAKIGEVHGENVEWVDGERYK
jgi:hypothetical protein